MYEYEVYNLECKECGTRLKIVATIQRGYSDHEKIYCTNCNSFIEEIRADMGYEVKEVIKP